MTYKLIKIRNHRMEITERGMTLKEARIVCNGIELRKNEWAMIMSENEYFDDRRVYLILDLKKICKQKNKKQLKNCKKKKTSCGKK